MTVGAIGNNYSYNYKVNDYPNSTKNKEDTTGKVNNDSKESDSKECQTCKNRKYVDGSNESNVSFKSAAHISPQSASAEVRTHEGEHVANAYSDASQNNGQVVSATVSIHTSICPECGRTYVSGGTTNTQIRYYNESNPYQQDLKAQDASKYRGANLDITA